jgi:hypothetical protein
MMQEVPPLLALGGRAERPDARWHEDIAAGHAAFGWKSHLELEGLAAGDHEGQLQRGASRRVYHGAIGTLGQEVRALPQPPFAQGQGTVAPALVELETLEPDARVGRIDRKAHLGRSHPVCAARAVVVVEGEAASELFARGVVAAMLGEPRAVEQQIAECRSRLGPRRVEQQGRFERLRRSPLVVGHEIERLGMPLPQRFGRAELAGIEQLEPLCAICVCLRAPSGRCRLHGCGRNVAVRHAALALPRAMKGPQAVAEHEDERQQGRHRDAACERELALPSRCGHEGLLDRRNQLEFGAADLGELGLAP